MKIKSSEWWQQIDSIFAGALSLSGTARSEYLTESCGADTRLRAEVEQLLAASEAAVDFLEVFDTTAAAALLDEASAPAASIGRYKVIRKIGAGGMGVVYLAEDASLKRRVAVKLLPPWLHASSDAKRRLLEEARAASAIDHPNIATVHEIGETDDGRLFITMSYYEGDTIRDVIERGPIDVGTALNLALQIATGLAAAHRKGIIHRDIKPENLLITADGIVKIVDFGLAGIEESTSTKSGTPVGTAAYMSPEQTLGAGLDVRTDLWSVGILLYEMLAGDRPFKSTDQDPVTVSIRRDPLIFTERLIRDLPAALRDVIERCLKKDPGSRYQSADDLIKDLKAIRDAGTSPVADRPTHEWRPVSGQRRALILAAVALTMIAGVGTAAVWRNARARDMQRPSSTVDPEITRGSIAVLPFADMSPGSDHAYLSDGMTEELIEALSGVEQLHVVARSSAFQFKGKPIDVREAGEKLGVAHILEGSVRSAGSKLRIVVRLVDAKRGQELWSQVFDRDDTDALAIQSEIAQAVVTALSVKLDPADRARLARNVNPDAHALYLKGQYLFNQRSSLDQALNFFRKALSIDGKYSDAWTGLGRTWLVMPVYSDVPFPQALDSAERAIETALSLDPNHAAAHATLGSMRADDWRWAESEPHFVRALQLNDGDATTHQWYGEMLLRTGRLPEAIEQLKAAEQRDPLTSVIPTNLGWMYLESGRYDEALSAFRSAIEFDPRHVQAHVGIGYALLDRGRFDEAIQALEKAAVLANGQRLTRAHLARGYALAGRKPDAEKVYDELKLEASRKNGSAWGAALVALALGRKDEALDWLERGYERREIAMGYLKTSQSFKPLRSDHRFIGLLKKMGL